jgi:hypothetical protein
MRALARCRVWSAALVLVVPSIAGWAQFPLGPGTTVQLAGVEQGRAILGQPDEYFTRMSAFDRMLRMRTQAEVSGAEYRDAVMRNVTRWPDEDRRLIASALSALAAKLEGLRLQLPPRVWVVRTTGIGEVGDAYTRANAIVLPARNLKGAPDRLQALLAHELFHLMTRYDARFREQAYRTIGFRIAEHVELPPSISPRRLTNPDALRNDAYVELTFESRPIRAVPVLLTRFERFDPKIGHDIADYWMMRLMVVEGVDGERRMKPVIESGEPVLLDTSQVQGFFEQVGTNTRYIVHPEEILADHFALMAMGAPSRQPEFIDRLRALFQ